jgi:enoyl-CoA hydratase/carnithine racemase
VASPGYFNAYANFAFERQDDGVLTCRLHTNEGPAVFDNVLHCDLSRVLIDIADDRDNRVLLLTGTGDSFLADIDLSSAGEVFKPSVWDPVLWEGVKIQQRLIDLPMPIVAAINGPVTVHSELALLADITVAASTATFRDDPHMNFEIVPGDGVHIIWEELLGLNRARYAALTQQSIDAEDALRLGMVNEVVAPEEVMRRAQEIAARLASKPTLYLRYTPIVLRQRLARRMAESTTMGLALEGLTMAQKAYQD